MSMLIRRLGAALWTKHPWGTDWRYSVPAYTLSVSFGISIGITLGCLIAGLPFWHAPLGVAVASVLARTLVHVQYQVEHQRAAAPS